MDNDMSTTKKLQLEAGKTYVDGNGIAWKVRRGYSSSGYPWIGVNANDATKSFTDAGIFCVSYGESVFDLVREA